MQNMCKESRMKNLYKESTEIFNFTAKTITLIDFIYMAVFYMTSLHPWISIALTLIFSLLNVPMVKLSLKHNKNYIDYSLALTLIPLYFVNTVSGIDTSGWLPAFSLLTAIEILVINKHYKIFLQVAVLVVVTFSNIELGRDISSLIIVDIILIIFILLMSTIMNYVLDINKKILESKQMIEDIHRHTKESIEYASMIQNALIPNSQEFQNYCSDFFSIWQQKDTVGGDIYLFDGLRDQDECLLMLIDCTGHGVPGALVTMLVKAIERQIVVQISNSDEIVSPAKLLAIFNQSMKHLLKQDSPESNSNAGFDGAILYYNKKNRIIRFAGAEIPLFIVEDDELRMIKEEKYSVGYKKCDANYQYTEHTIEVKDGMRLYLTTDGYLDQNGGEKGFPFGKKRFKKIITENYQKPMSQQKEVFLNSLKNYQGSEERNDDITLIGLKI